MLQQTINGNIYKTEMLEDGRITINGESFEFDIAQIKTRHLHLIADNNAFSAEIVNYNEANKLVQLKINGFTVDVAIKTETDLLLDKLGIGTKKATSANNINAPMPGLIVDILVEVGAVVKKGDALLILEAMKMENLIKAPADGILKDIKVDKGQKVEKQQLLLMFE